MINTFEALVDCVQRINYLLWGIKKLGGGGGGLK